MTLSYVACGDISDEKNYINSFPGKDDKECNSINNQLIQK